jgi:hypothetical protein
MTPITTEGSARAWVGACYGLAVNDGAKNATDMHSTNVAKAPSRGEGRALPGRAGRDVWLGLFPMSGGVGWHPPYGVNCRVGDNPRGGVI